MLFVSTRGKTDLVCSAHAITRGLADDGGLFVPQKFPELSLGEIVSMRSMTYKRTGCGDFIAVFDRLY